MAKDQEQRKERCETCHHWFSLDDEDVEERGDFRKGDCRRYPPQVDVGHALIMVILNKSMDVASWRPPETAAWEWCGEWKPKESGPTYPCGHPKTEANTYVDILGGWNVCLTCERAKVRGESNG